jgi:putative DNA primase/helicase
LHDDRHPSLRVNPNKGLWRCDPCDSGGDIFGLHAAARGLDAKSDRRAIEKELCQLFGLSQNNGHQHVLTLAELAAAKRLSVGFLKQNGVTDDAGGVVFYHFLEDGTPAKRHHLRTALHGASRFKWTGRGELVPYGLETLREARARGELVVAEGDTDRLTLRLHGIPALGLPGAGAAGLLQAEHIRGISRILIAQDTDEAGARFVARVAERLSELDRDDQPLVVQMPEGVKDVNALHVQFAQEPNEFKRAWATATEIAQLPEAPLPPEFSEVTMAQRFANLHSANLRYVAPWNQWLRWREERWQADDTLEVFSLSREVCREASVEALKLPRGKAVAQQLASARTIAAVEKLARADRRLAAKVDQWDRDPWLLNTPGGAVDLSTGKIRPHRPEDYATKMTTVAPESGVPRIWLNFLDRVFDGDKELISFLQRFCGYCLTGETVEQVLLFFYGTGANGKSVLINTLAGVLKDYAITTAIDLFTVSIGDRHPTELARLRGARLAIASEIEEGRYWAESRIKLLTGGDKISARQMRQDFFEYQPQFKLLLSGNHKPSLRDVNEAIRRRFYLVPFGVTIPLAERDKALPQKLRAERSQILQWAIEGCLEWQEHGLKPSKAVRDASEDYLSAEDLIEQWITDCCCLDPQHFESTTNLYNSYYQWSISLGEFPLKGRHLVQALEGRGFVRHRDRGPRGNRGLLGLGLKRSPAPFDLRSHCCCLWNRPLARRRVETLNAPKQPELAMLLTTLAAQ